MGFRFRGPEWRPRRTRVIPALAMARCTVPEHISKIHAIVVAIVAYTGLKSVWFSCVSCGHAKKSFANALDEKLATKEDVFPFAFDSSC